MVSEVIVAGNSDDNMHWIKTLALFLGSLALGWLLGLASLRIWN